jgi:acyl-CoA synthetase (AMP-forming)/AMP-acid ligase II
MAHPDVLDAAVVARPDAELGEVPVAYVSLRGDSIPPELLDGWFAERLAPWKHPRDLIVLDRVPRTPTGKLCRRELIERERAVSPLV